ncbi:MAG: methyltransferase domain-containing protein [Synechococcaceae cyanobacterium]|nr:methyltransferase domain-containing protein [Synechococcaceae cyanobacterium]
MTHPDDSYVLGTGERERERLLRQHRLWLPAARAAWERAGLGRGQRVLDLGAGPGFCSVELARAVGPGGRVLALERSGEYVQAARTLAARDGLEQLEVLRHDIATDPVPAGRFDLALCRWVAMFLPRLDPLLQLLEEGLRPGGRFVAQEYVHWDTFGLHPRGEAVARFGRAVTASFRAAGGDPDVNRRLPSLLAGRGFRITELRPLPVLGRPGDPWARWLERFVRIYGAELIRQGRWSTEEAARAEREMEAARADPGSCWMGPTVLELHATRLPSGSGR